MKSYSKKTYVIDIAIGASMILAVLLFFIFFLMFLNNVPGITFLIPEICCIYIMIWGLLMSLAIVTFSINGLKNAKKKKAPSESDEQEIRKFISGMKTKEDKINYINGEIELLEREDEIKNKMEIEHLQSILSDILSEKPKDKKGEE